MGLSCKFCKEVVPIDKWKEHQKKHGLPIPTEMYRKLIKLWETEGKPIIKGNVVERYFGDSTLFG